MGWFGSSGVVGGGVEVGGFVGLEVGWVVGSWVVGSWVVGCWVVGGAGGRVVCGGGAVGGRRVTGAVVRPLVVCASSGVGSPAGCVVGHGVVVVPDGSCTCPGFVAVGNDVGTEVGGGTTGVVLEGGVVSCGTTISWFG